VTDAVVFLALLVIATAVFGLMRRLRDGRMRLQASPVDGAALPAQVLTPALLGSPLAPRATFVQFSSAFCQPCRATRVLLETLLDGRDGVAHIEIDAESHLDLVRRFEIVRTPTVLVLDHDGHVRGRATGVPRRDQVLEVLDSLGVADAR
jgi:thiol-disulfide isomerase/thioredoxin